MSKIVVWEKDMIDHGDLDWSALMDLGEVIFCTSKEREKAEDASQDADVIVINKTIIDTSFLEKFPDLRFISIAATGYDNIDLDACKKAGVGVNNVVGYGSESVAQHVIALLLSYLHDSYTYSSDVKEGGWMKRGTFSFSDHSIRALNDMTMGIWGYGGIGSRVGSIAKAFGMKILATHRHEIADKAIHRVDLETLFSECDVISLHVPLTDETSQAIDKNLLNRCKDDVILINTARGGLINESDLADFLNTHEKAVALLDVLSKEPPPSDHILLELENVVITPHQAWSSLYAREQLLKGIVNNILGYENADTAGFLVGL